MLETRDTRGWISEPAAVEDKSKRDDESGREAMIRNQCPIVPRSVDEGSSSQE
jgi:hypothetical protein